MAARNPFRYSGPLAPDEMVDRDAEANHLLDLARGGHIARLEAPRRYGKTSLIGRVLNEAASEEMVVARVDFEDVLSLGAVVSRIERAYDRSLRGSIRAWVDRLLQSWNLGVALGPSGFAVHLNTNPAIDPEPVLLRLLELPERVYEQHGRRCLIVFDEVGDLHEVRGAAGIIRSVIQHHLDAASYVFTGSAPSLMRRLFDDPNAPFLQQGVPVKLDPLPAGDLYDHIAGRFEATDRSPGDSIGELISFARGHPQRAMMLAHHLWDRVPQGDSTQVGDFLDARDAAHSESRLALKAYWTALPGTERRAAMALAVAPHEPGGKAILARVGLSQDSVYGALDALEGRGDVLSTDEGRRLTDPLLEFWLRTRYEGAEP